VSAPVQEKIASIRRAHVEDAAGASELLEILGYRAPIAQIEERIARSRESPDAAVFVAELDGRLVGLASFHRIPLFYLEGFLGRITSFVIAPSHRRHGIGRSLVSAVEEFAWDHGCTRAEVTSGDHRSDAHEFYERLGYRPVSRRFIKEKTKKT
jgi:GNAT superfamily N-acetyltransferase